MKSHCCTTAAHRNFHDPVPHQVRPAYAEATEPYSDQL